MTAASRARVAIAALALSAAGFVGIALEEGYTDRAIIPVPGDVPTVGFGTTTRPDGSPVQMGDTTTPPAAIARALRDVQKFEGAIRQCVTVPLHPHEYDVYVSFTYNVGAAAFCSSTLVRRLNAGDYAGACAELSRWVYAGSTVVQGLVKRRERERRKCEGWPLSSARSARPSSWPWSSPPPIAACVRHHSCPRRRNKLQE